MRMEMVPRGLFSSFLPERCFLISTISVVDWDGDAKALVSSTTKEVYGYRSTIKTLSIVSTLHLRSIIIGQRRWVIDFRLCPLLFAFSTFYCRFGQQWLLVLHAHSKLLFRLVLSFV